VLIPAAIASFASSLMVCSLKRHVIEKVRCDFAFRREMNATLRTLLRDTKVTLRAQPAFDGARDLFWYLAIARPPKFADSNDAAIPQ
jgi:hypothetical protein